MKDDKISQREREREREIYNVFDVQPSPSFDKHFDYFQVTFVNSEVDSCPSGDLYTQKAVIPMYYDNI